MEVSVSVKVWPWAVQEGWSDLGGVPDSQFNVGVRSRGVITENLLGAVSP